MDPAQPASLPKLEARILARIPREIVVVAFILALPAALIFDFTSGLLCLAGGIASAIWFIWVKKAVGRFLSPVRQPVIFWLGFHLLRVGLIGLVFLFIIYTFSRRALAFLAGFSAVVLVFLGEAVLALSRMKSWKA